MSLQFFFSSFFVRNTLKLGVLILVKFFFVFLLRLGKGVWMVQKFWESGDLVIRIDEGILWL